MDDSVLLSIIVPVYKAEAYLDRCVQSILAQTFRDFELILVDDGSPDRCPQMCEEWAKKDSRIRVLHQQNKGLSGARNSGLRAARGSCIGFVDSDDWVDPGMYECLHSLLTRYAADVALCEFRISNGSARVERVKPAPEEIWSRKEYLDCFFRIHGERSNYGVWRGLYRREFLRDFSFIEGKINEDVAAGYWFAVHSRKTVHTNAVYYNYFHNPQSITTARFTPKKLDLLDIWEMIAQKVPQEAPEYVYACEMNQKRAYFSLLVNMDVMGYDRKDQKLRDIRKKFKSEIRGGVCQLLRWPMPLSRKILLLLECI